MSNQIHVRKKKLVFVIGQLGLGGGEKQLYLLLKGLDKGLFAPVVVSLNPGKNDYWESHISSLHIPLDFIPHNRNTLKRIWNLWRYIYRSKPDIVISWTLHLNFFVALGGRLVRNCKTVVSIRCDLYNATSTSIGVNRFLGTKLAHRYVTNSTDGLKTLVKIGVGEEKVSVIFNAITPLTLTSSHHKAAIRTQFGLPVDSFLLLNVGRLEKGKNQIMLLQALFELHQKGYTNIKVACIGKGDNYKSVLENRALETGIQNSVFFLGQVPNAYQIFPAFDVLCHCSVGEGMSNVIVEAGLTELPVITTRVNGATDLIDDQVSGYIVDQNAVEQVVQSVISLYEHAQKRNAVSKRFKEHLLSPVFSEAEMVSKFSALFAGI